MFLITSHYIIYLYFCFLYCYNPLLMLANIWCPPIFFHPKNGTFTLGNGTVKQKLMNPIIMYISLPAIILFFFLFYNMNASLQCLQISMMPDFSSVSFTFVQQEYKTMFSLCSFRRLLDTVSSRRQIDGMACLSSSIFFYLL